MKQEDLKTIAKLSRIQLTQEELDKYTPQMTSILESADVLNELDTEEVQVYSPHTTPLSKLRDDEVKPGLKIDEVLQNAPFKKESYIMVYGKITEGVEA